MGTKITEIAWIRGIFVNKSIKWHFFRKKIAEKFVSSKKSITFAPHLEKCSFRKAKSRRIFEGLQAEIAQLVEHNLAKVGVAGPSPVFRSLVEQKRALGIGPNVKNAQVAELVDAHVSGACAARRAGSSPVLGTLFYSQCQTLGEVAELVDALL